MAGMSRWHQGQVRATIKTGLLINRLTEFALGKIELSATQVRAIGLLLKKTLPDLSSVELSGDPGRPVATRIELVGVRPDGNCEG